MGQIVKHIVLAIAIFGSGLLYAPERSYTDFTYSFITKRPVSFAAIIVLALYIPWSLYTIGTQHPNQQEKNNNLPTDIITLQNQLKETQTKLAEREKFILEKFNPINQMFGPSLNKLTQKK